MSKKITVYTTPSCPYCVIAKEFFKKNNLSYEEISALNAEIAQKLVAKTGQTGVPQIFINENEQNEKFVIGFNEEELKKLLGL